MLRMQQRCFSCHGLNIDDGRVNEYVKVCDQYVDSTYKDCIRPINSPCVLMCECESVS